MGSRTQRSPRDSFGSLGRPSPDSQSSAVISLLSHARTLRVPYGEQKRMLAQALLADPHFAETGELLQTMEKGVLYPVVHLYELPGPFVPMDDQLLGQDRLGPDYVLHQGIYEEIRQHLPYGPSPYAPADERRTAYIVAGFKVLDATFRDVMENSWKDWTGARSLYINLAHEFGLHRFSLYRRSRPRNDFSTFSYVLLVECRAVTSENALRLLDFVQRFRSHRMSGYLSVYNSRHLALESYSRDAVLFSPSLHGGSDWWKQVQDAVATNSNGSTSDLSSTSESTSSDDNPRSHAVLRSSAAVSSARMQPMPAVEIVPTTTAKRFVTGSSAPHPSHHGRNGTTMTPIYENLTGRPCSSRSPHGGTTSNGSTNGLAETDLSYSIEDTSSGTNNVESGSDESDARPRSSRSTMRRVWFEDCVLDNVIAQAAERDVHGTAAAAAPSAREAEERSLAKEYLALDEMLRNLQCADVPPEPAKQSVRRKLW